jgi:hypothetical protein
VLEPGAFCWYSKMLPLRHPPWRVRPASMGADFLGRRRADPLRRAFPMLEAAARWRAHPRTVVGKPSSLECAAPCRPRWSSECFCFREMRLKPPRSQHPGRPPRSSPSSQVAHHPAAWPRPGSAKRAGRARRAKYSGTGRSDCPSASGTERPASRAAPSRGRRRWPRGRGRRPGSRAGGGARRRAARPR